MATPAADQKCPAVTAAVVPILTEIKATTLTMTTTTTRALLSSVSSSGLVTVVRNNERQPSLVLNKSASSFSFNNNNNNYNNGNKNNKQKMHKICRQKSVYLDENSTQSQNTGCDESADQLKKSNLLAENSHGSFLSCKTDSVVTIIPNNSIHKQSSISSVTCVVNCNFNQINCANEENLGSLERVEKSSIESPTDIFSNNNNNNNNNNERNIPLSVSSNFSCSNANNDFTLIDYKTNETRNTKKLFVNEPSSLKSSFNSVR